MKPAPPSATSPDLPMRSRVFAALFGAFLGLTLLKFGNPPIMEQWVAPPTDAWEFFLGCPWPIAWAYAMLGGIVVVLGLFVACLRLEAPRGIVALPLVWLGWQLVSATQTVDSKLTGPTLAHFVACCACFYLGLLCLGRTWRLPVFWLGITVGFLLVIATGFGQHFGGLEQTRRYFYTYVYANMKEMPPEYLKKMSSNRIFSTLFYPNALAGAILLLLPPVLSLMAGARQRFTLPARVFLVGAVSLAAAACLYWSGSKGGWLLLLLLGLIALLRIPFDKRRKLLLVSGILFVGLAAFAWQYSGFFKKGATSVVARFDYWQAAIRTFKAHPLAGTGPGTFAKPYLRIKKPQSEMSRLVHNDYLEQASDSGSPGFLAYTAFIVAALLQTYPRRSNRVPEPEPVNSETNRSSRPQARTGRAGAPSVKAALSQAAPARQIDWPAFAIWLGVLGWALQSLVEFGLYIPALAWPAFGFMGLLLGRPGQKPNYNGQT